MPLLQAQQQQQQQQQQQLVRIQTLSGESKPQFGSKEPLRQLA